METLVEIGKEFGWAFVPLLVAINPLGIIPLYISLTSGVSRERQQSLIRSALLAAVSVATLILVAGQLIFKLLGITADDFRIGGGLVLLLIAILDLVSSKFDQRKSDNTELGVVPLGIPLMVGPAALTTIMVLVDKVGYLTTLAALLANLMLVWFLFANSSRVVFLLGKGGTKALGKIASLFMVAIAVMMIRVGITNLLSQDVLP